MLAEEAIELALACFHFNRGDRNKARDSLQELAEEIADVELLIDELKFYLQSLKLFDFSLANRVEEVKKEKLKRLEEKLK